MLNKQWISLTDDIAMDTGDVMDSDDADWYREEVGEEPDPGKAWCLALQKRMPFERITSFT